MKEKNLSKTFTIPKQELFDREIAEKLILILDKYCFFDLCRAVFCFNSWRYTRPHLNFYLTLNYVVCNIKCKEQCEINDYKTFSAFVNEIIQFYDGTFDDEILPDFGEIKIQFNKHFYPVFMGTGHDFMFSFLESLEALSNSLKIVGNMQTVLQYVAELVSLYGTVEPLSLEKYSPKKILPPTKEYFDKCLINYKSKELHNDEFLRKLSFEQQKDVEISHFVKFSEQYLPLFNPSIIVDAFDYLYNSSNVSSDLKTNCADTIVYDALFKNYDRNPDSKNILFNVGIVENINDNKIYNNLAFNYVIFDGNSTLFLINRNRCENINMDELIDIIQKEDKLNIVEQVSQNECMVYTIKDIGNILFIMYDDVVQLNFHLTFGYEYSNLQFCTLYDLVSMFYQSNTIDDIIKFFKYLKSQKTNYSFVTIPSGYSALFSAWLQNNQEIIQGANGLCYINTDVYMVEWNILNKFIELKEWYPFQKYDEMFFNPFSWIIDNETLGFRRLTSNCVTGFGGCFRKINNSYIFLTFNLNFENFDDEWNKRDEVINSVEELMERNFLELESTLVKSNVFNYNGVQLIYLPMHYAKKVDNNGFLKKQKKYVFSDVNLRDNKILIRFAINEDKLFRDILDSKNRKIECDFMLELLSPLKDIPNINFCEIEKYLLNSQNLQKNIDVIVTEQEYIFSNRNFGLWPGESFFVKVRKDIAIKCKNLGIKAKCYKSEEATTIIRKLQNKITKEFEDKVAEYDQFELHEKLLSIIAYFLHEKIIEKKRYEVKDRANLIENAKYYALKNIIHIREESKAKIRTLYYLIDTNLSIKHNSDVIQNIKNDDLEYLIAYAHCLQELQDCADNAHYNLFEASIDIEDDFLISTNFSEEYLKNLDSRNKRIYDNVDYKPILSSDKEMFDKSLSAFYMDTGVKLEYIIQLCKYFAMEFSYTFKEQKNPDVYSINKNELIKDYESILKDKSEENKIEFLKVLDYLIIDKNLIKIIDGQTEEFVPIWERERRDVCFEVRPIVQVGDHLIFSPLVMFELYQRWNYGSLEFYPPYEIGLNNYMKCLSGWKKLCEKEMENDIFKFFLELGFKTEKNIKLHRLDKQFGHPDNLGDYDVIAIDKVNKTLWNIESKFLGMVGSIKEYYNHQDSFFNKDKKDEKFSNRINYLHDHKKDILKLFDVSDGENYVIHDYMVTNKVFSSELKKINFAIITFDELKKMVKYQYYN